MLHAVTRLFGSRTGSAIAWEFVAATRPFSRALPAKRWGEDSLFLGCANPQNKEAVWSQSQRKIDCDTKKAKRNRTAIRHFKKGIKADKNSCKKYLK
jgi:hypothetical protein